MRGIINQMLWQWTLRTEQALTRAWQIYREETVASKTDGRLTHIHPVLLLQRRRQQCPSIKQQIHTEMRRLLGRMVIKFVRLPAEAAPKRQEGKR